MPLPSAPTRADWRPWRQRRRPGRVRGRSRHDPCLLRHVEAVDDAMHAQRGGYPPFCAPWRKKAVRNGAALQPENLREAWITRSGRSPNARIRHPAADHPQPVLSGSPDGCGKPPGSTRSWPNIPALPSSARMSVSPGRFFPRRVQNRDNPPKRTAIPAFPMIPRRPLRADGRESPASYPPRARRRRRTRRNSGIVGNPRFPQATSIHHHLTL
jgi:hypothetical protein